MSTRLRLVVAVVLVALLAAGCGGGGDDSGGRLTSLEQDYADALARDLAGDAGVSAQDGKCIAEGVLGVLGTQPFEDADVQPEDIGDGTTLGKLLGEGAVSDDEADAAAEAWNACVDLPAVFAQQSKGNFDLDEAGLACFEEELAKSTILDEYLHVYFTSASASEGQAVLQRVVALVQQCTAESGGGGGVLVDRIATSLGKDPRFDETQARCIAQQVVTTIGAERLVALGGAGGDLAEAPPEAKQELSDAVVAAAQTCNVPLSQLGGG